MIQSRLVRDVLRAFRSTPTLIPTRGNWLSRSDEERCCCCALTGLYIARHGERVAVNADDVRDWVENTYAVNGEYVLGFIEGFDRDRPLPAGVFEESNPDWQDGFSHGVTVWQKLNKGGLR